MKIVALLLILLAVSVYADDWSSFTEEQKFNADPQRAFNENPTGDNFARPEVPKTADNFDKLSPAEKTLHWNLLPEEEKLIYLQKKDFTQSSDQKLADSYFSEIGKSDHVNSNRPLFEKYMLGKGVSIAIQGNVVEYSEGKLKTARASVTNLYSEVLKSRYNFLVDKDGNLIIFEKQPGAPHHTVEGVVKSTHDEDSKFPESLTWDRPVVDGKLDGHSFNGIIFEFYANGDVRVSAKTVGGVTFYGAGPELWNPAKNTVYAKDVKVTAIDPKAKVSIAGESIDFGSLLSVPATLSKGTMVYTAGEWSLNGESDATIANVRLLTPGYTTLYFDGRPASVSSVSFGKNSIELRNSGIDWRAPEQKALVVEFLPNNSFVDVQKYDFFKAVIRDGDVVIRSPSEVLPSNVSSAPEVLVTGNSVKIINDGLGLDKITEGNKWSIDYLDFRKKYGEGSVPMTVNFVDNMAWVADNSGHFFTVPGNFGNLVVDKAGDVYLAGVKKSVVELKDRMTLGPLQINELEGADLPVYWRMTEEQLGIEIGFGGDEQFITESDRLDALFRMRQKLLSYPPELRSTLSKITFISGSLLRLSPSGKPENVLGGWAIGSEFTVNLATAEVPLLGIGFEDTFDHEFGHVLDHELPLRKGYRNLAGEVSQYFPADDYVRFYETFKKEHPEYANLELGDLNKLIMKEFYKATGEPIEFLNYDRVNEKYHLEYSNSPLLSSVKWRPEGFASGYGQTNGHEDIAEVFKRVLHDSEDLRNDMKTDPALKEKVLSLVKSINNITKNKMVENYQQFDEGYWEK